MQARPAQAETMREVKTVERALSEMATLLRLSGEARYKVAAFESAADSVAAIGNDLGPLVEAGRLTEISGFGKSLARHITELWTTGTASALEELRAALPRGAAELAPLDGMTLRRMRTLSSALGVGSLSELEAALAAGRLRGLAGFDAKVEARLLKACALAREQAPVERRLVVGDALALASELQAGLERVAHVELAGAARRGEDTVAELSFVAPAEAREAVLERLSELKGVVWVDRTRDRAYLSKRIPLELEFAPAAELGSRLLEATGPAAHVQALADWAEDRHITLRELHEPDEAELYRKLGLAPVPPELRRGQDELALASAAGFADLVAERDVRGMVHCHTTYSDGKDSIEAMARAAEARGMAYITITDHSPTASYAGGVGLDRLKQQWDEIAAVQERVSIRILRGTESDIVADGGLDYPDTVLEQLDVVIASIHSRLKMDRMQMTERLVRAMQLPVFKIWGHPLGRMLLAREPFECDLEAVLSALAGGRGAVELNGDPHRLDLPADHIPRARAHGLSFVLSVDAHSTTGLGALTHAVRMARRGGVRREEVLNTLPLDAFIARVRPTA
jgi:DNA polymerase (family 10)